MNQLHSDGLQNVTGVVCHVGKAEDRKKLLQEAVDKYGGLDILVSNAAVNPSVGGVLDVSKMNNRNRKLSELQELLINSFNFSVKKKSGTRCLTSM